jgi:hypothetical protein
MSRDSLSGLETVVADPAFGQAKMTEQPEELERAVARVECDIADGKRTSRDKSKLSRKFAPRDLTA